MFVTVFSLISSHVLNEFGQEYTFLQGDSMGRPSHITTKLINKNNPRVLVGGNGIILTKGELRN